MSKKNKTVMRKIQEGREYRYMPVVLETRSEEEDNYIVEGYATTFGTSYELYRYGGYIFTEQVDAHAFDNADMSDVIMQFDHEGMVYARMSNKTLRIIIDAHGLKVRADLGGTASGRELYEAIKGGYVTRMSIGFTVAEDSVTETTDHDTNITTVLRVITKVRKLYDVSAVSIPANDATEISARSCDGWIGDLMEEHRKMALEELKVRLKLLEV